MKKQNLYAVCLICSSLGLMSSLGYATLAGKKIGLDAGHGTADDRGGVYIGEGTWVLDGALKTEVYLKNDGATVVQTRRDATNVAIANRVTIWNSNNCQVGLSIHSNAADASIEGVVEYRCSLNVYSSTSIVVAQKLLNRLLTMVKNKARGTGIKECLDAGRGFHFGMIKDPVIPCALSETYFHTNPTENYDFHYLDSGRDKIARAFYAGICDYFGVIPNLSSSTPSVPVLSSPANGSTGASLTPTLTWNLSTGATYYRVQVDDTSNFSSTVIDQAGITSNSYAVTAGKLSFSTTYYWRVNAGNTYGSSSWSSVWSLYLSSTSAGDTTPPAVPVLVSPSNTTKITNTTPTFEWNDVSDPSGVIYKIQVDDESNFTSPILLDIRGLSSSQYVSTATLVVNTTYYWRVKAVDGANNESSWTNSWNLCIVTVYNDTTPPTNPTTCNAWSNDTKNVSIPDNSVQGLSSTVYFEWGVATDTGSGVSGYNVYWGVDANGDPGTVQTQTTTKYWITTPVSSGSTYYLRIRTRDNKGNWSSASTLFTFKYEAGSSILSISNVSITPSSGVFSPNGDGNNDTVNISYTLSEGATVTIKILNNEFDNDIIVKTILNNKSQSQGAHTEPWDGKDDNGNIAGDRTYAFMIEAVSGQKVATPQVGTIVVSNNISSGSGPAITHTPLVTDVGVYNDKIKVTTLVTQTTTTVSRVFLNYQTEDANGWSVWKNVNLTSSGNDNYVGEIPATDITSQTKRVEYYIGAVDSAGRDSLSGIQRVTMLSSSESIIYVDGGEIKLADGNPDDGEAKISIPAGSIEDGTKITMMQKNAKDVTSVPLSGTNEFIDGNNISPIVAYEITSSGSNQFSQAVTISLLYFDLDNNGIIDGTTILESNTRVFWYDGTQWRHLGGIVDITKNVISAKVNHLTLYAIFPVKSSGFSARDYVPKERVITPNQDSQNDYVCFNGIHNYYASLSYRGDTENGGTKDVRIYDLNNRLVKTLTDNDIWDGKDSNGNLVESGIYLYKYVVEKQVVSGTIVIAR